MKYKNTEPHFFRPNIPSFYRTCGALIGRCSSSLGHNHTSKIIYQSIVPNISHAAHMAGLSSETLKHTFQILHNSRIRPSPLETSFRLAYNILPSDTRAGGGASIRCWLCDTRTCDEIRHTFFQCKTTQPAVQLMTLYIQDTLHEEIHKEAALKHTILPKVCSHTTTINALILAETRQAIWNARNASKHRRYDITPHSITHAIHRNLYKRLLRDRERNIQSPLWDSHSELLDTLSYFEPP